MAKGFREGETLRELTDRVQSFFKQQERTKSVQIARTESSRAIHSGMEFAWDQSQVVHGKEWLCNPG